MLCRYLETRQTDRHEWTLFWFGFVTPGPAADGQGGKGGREEDNEGPVEKRIPAAAAAAASTMTRRCSRGGGGCKGLKQRTVDTDGNQTTSNEILARAGLAQVAPF